MKKLGPKARLALKISLAVIIALVAFVIVAKRTPTTVHVERTFNAPVAKVWKLWNDPESMKKWWSPEHFTAPVIKNDPKVGGKFLLSMRSPEGEMFWNTGSYTEVIPNQKMVAQFSFSDENGNVIPGAQVPVPGVWPDAITVTVDFKEVDGKTQVSVTEEGIPLIMKLFAKMGWEQQFDKFEKLL